MSNIVKNIFPRPQILEEKNGTFKLSTRPVVLFPYGKSEEIFRTFNIFAENVKKEAGIDLYLVPDYKGKLNVEITFAFDEKLEGEKYEIDVNENGIFVSFGTPVGAFRAQTTVAQMLYLWGREQKFLHISDWPGLEYRGFMLDISRHKVPKLEKLFRIVDILASVKANEFQLYLEHFAVEYPDFPEYANVIEGLTPFEIVRLTNYAKERYITLVPNQNSFGHLAHWLRRDELKHLGITDNPGCSTLNPIDPESVEFVGKLYNSLIPSFDADRINIGCDEVSSMESGKAAERAKEISAVGVYLEYLTKINEKVREHGMRAMFWGDILLRHVDDEEVLKKVPKDMIPLLWGYNGHDTFEPNAVAISKLGYDFYICPGTSAWINMFPDLENANLNVLDAANCAYKYGARGMLMTEWGDFGHIQFDFTMYLGMMYSQAVAWNLDGNRDFKQTRDYADTFIFKTTGDVTASELICRGAELYDQAYFFSFKTPIDERGYTLEENYNQEHYKAELEGMDSIEADAKRLHSAAEDGEQLERDFIVSARFNRFITKWLSMRLEHHETGTISDFANRYSALRSEIDVLAKDIHECWNYRNKPTGNDHFLNTVRQGLTKLDDAMKG